MLENQQRSKNNYLDLGMTEEKVCWYQRFLGSKQSCQWPAVSPKKAALTTPSWRNCKVYLIHRMNSNLQILHLNRFFLFLQYKKIDEVIIYQPVTSCLSIFRVKMCYCLCEKWTVVVWFQKLWNTYLIIIIP